jgi:hypothetical protein
MSWFLHIKGREETMTNWNSGPKRIVVRPSDADETCVFGEPAIPGRQFRPDPARLVRQLRPAGAAPCALGRDDGKSLMR